MKKECLDYNETVDVGVILEQNWMVDYIADNFEDGELIYCFSIDRDIYLIERNGIKYAFLQAHGSAPTGCYVEEMKKRSAKKVYRIGTCGALQSNINFGDVVISTAAIRDEGTSDQYIPKYFPAMSPPEHVKNISTKLAERGLTVHNGITWTTDGRFVESNEKILSFSKLGVKNVDMETSALMIVCQMKNIPGISIGVVTDRPIDDVREEFKGRIHNLSENRKMLSERLFDIGHTVLNSI